MHAERVDGYNPLAIADAVERKQQVLAEGRGLGISPRYQFLLSPTGSGSE